MRALVTGATGFLGRYVTAELLKRGHTVRAVVRPATDVSAVGWCEDVELFRAGHAFNVAHLYRSVKCFLAQVFFMLKVPVS